MAEEKTFEALVDVDGDGKYSKSELDAVWKTMDVNKNGMLSLAEIDKALKQNYPSFAADSRSMIRAFKLADKDGSGEINRREFGELIRQLDRVQKMSRLFAKLDTSGDGRISLEEFKKGFELADIPATGDVETEFKKLDTDRGGFVLFAELVDYMVNKKYEADYEPDTLLAPSIEKDFFGGFWDKKELDKLWRETDKNGDGTLDEREVRNLVLKVFPKADKKIVGRAMRAADKNLDGVISRGEFVPLIHAIDDLIEISELFKALDTDYSQKIDKDEFKRGFDLLKLPQPKNLDALFKKLDRDGGGTINFVEFATYMKKARDTERRKQKKSKK